MAAIRTVERAEGRVLLHAHFGHVNHATPFGWSEFFAGIVNADIIVVLLEDAEPGAARSELEFATESEDGIAEGLGFEALRWIAPEQT